MSVNKRVFEVDGKEYAVVKPSARVKREADQVRAIAYTDSMRKGCMTRDQFDKMVSEESWYKETDKEYKKMQIELLELINKLNEGGKLSDAKKVAVQIAIKRRKMVDLLSSTTEMYNNTCDGIADQERFNFLVSQCLVYNDTGERVYQSIDDYWAEADSELAEKAATEFYYLSTNTDNLDDTLPENIFLKKYRLIDDNKRLTEPSTGRLTDLDGRYVDDEGYFIKYNEDGTTYRVDIEGNPVKERVEPVFLDDDGNPIVLDQPKKTTRRKRKATKTEA